MMEYDVIVVGGGHAGVEASLASARMGHKTLLISMLAENVTYYFDRCRYLCWSCY